MNDSKNITIVMLLISAVILSVLLLATQPTHAGNSSARFGDYVMSAGARADSFDNLYVIDVLQKRLNVYSTDPEGRPHVAAQRKKYLADHIPGSTYLLVAGLAQPEWRVEMDVTAAKVD